MSEQLVSTKRRFTAEEYLAVENASSIRHEFVDGELYAMAGTTLAHNDIIRAVVLQLSLQIPSTCRVNFIDIKLKVVVRKAENFYYPDVMVTCGPTVRSKTVIENPVLLIEVLSKSTERIDRTEKFSAYTTIPSLQAYALIDPETPRVEFFRRARRWQIEELGAKDIVELPALGVALSVRQLYEAAGFDFATE